MDPIDEITEVEDRRFLASINNIISELERFSEAMKERRRWRDVYGVMHELVPLAGVDMGTGQQLIVDWLSRCGYARLGNSLTYADPGATVTCLRCIGTIHTDP